MRRGATGMVKNVCSLGTGDWDTTYPQSKRRKNLDEESR